ncbi:hypothetical protein SCLCIDRAFT_1211875 [Scleroderma citrinum Foug A]|uniref:Uncharacterized protein n=1 Tax=Scleroderma citrinum Foug A TaxID=1036808 RepID=A0A0C3ED67_9AGAM|nr:hypothetical protein SCLCIDRAFT_1211875 [Scleroderma citrinum Foug A]
MWRSCSRKSARYRDTKRINQSSDTSSSSPRQIKPTSTNPHASNQYLRRHNLGMLPKVLETRGKKILPV